MAFNSSNSTHNAAPKIRKTTWAVTLASGDTGNGAAIPVIQSETVSIQVTGSFGAAGTVLIKGSNDGSNFVAFPVAITFSGAGMATIPDGERPLWIRPEFTNPGVGGGNYVVTVVCREAD